MKVSNYVQGLCILQSCLNTYQLYGIGFSCVPLADVQVFVAVNAYVVGVLK